MRKVDLLANFEFTIEELKAGLGDPMWRLTHLYKILTKKGEVITFKPNTMQQYLLDNMHTRNLIIKSRQIGFSTLIQILALDTALFSPNVKSVTICQDLLSSESLYREKVRFAYDNLPEALRQALPLDGQASKTALSFPNGSRVEVRTGARGSTPNFLHCSEFAAIASTDAQKAREVILGALTAAPEDALVFIESTARGVGNDFHTMCTKAKELQEIGKPLHKLEHKLFFFGWHDDPTNVAKVGAIAVTDRDNEYFDEIELHIKKRLSPEQRTWWVLTKERTYLGDTEAMYQEQPSTFDEPFKVSLEGAYFTEQFRKINADRRITRCKYDPAFSTSTFWDIGSGDATSIWIVQPRRSYYAVIGYIEAEGESFSYFTRKLDELNYNWDFHALPHDAGHRRQGGERNQTPEEILQSIAPHFRFQLVPRTSDKVISIEQARTFLSQCVFDEEACAEGIAMLKQYRKEWDSRAGTWKRTPRHDKSSNAADAFMQAAQAKSNGQFSSIGNLRGFDGGMGDFFEQPSMGF